MSLSSGVQQGSVLGPALFLLFINDLTMSVKNCNIYADDTMLDATGDNVTDVTQNLQREIDNVTEWFKNNRLKVNPNKCCSMLVGTRQRLGNSPKSPTLGLTIGDTFIENRDSYTYLGVNIDSYLSFHDMINCICNKLRSRVCLFYRVSCYTPKLFLTNLYFAFIQPVIDYCILIWGLSSDSNIHRIQSFQNRAARIISNEFSFSVSGTSLVNQLGWLNVTQRRDFLYACIIFKCIHRLAPDYLTNEITFMHEIQNRVTRQHNLLHVPFAKTSCFKKSFSIYGPQLWNSLPLELRSMNDLECFKRSYKFLIKNGLL